MHVVAIAIALLLLSGGAIAAEVPAYCARLDPSSPVYATLCRSAPVAPPITPAATAPSTVTVEIACGNWTVYRNGSVLIVACPGRSAPAGAAPLYCTGTVAQCGR